MFLTLCSLVTVSWAIPVSRTLLRPSRDVTKAWTILSQESLSRNLLILSTTPTDIHTVGLFTRRSMVMLVSNTAPRSLTDVTGAVRESLTITPDSDLVICQQSLGSGISGSGILFQGHPCCVQPFTWDSRSTAKGGLLYIIPVALDMISQVELITDIVSVHSALVNSTGSSICIHVPLAIKTTGYDSIQATVHSADPPPGLPLTSADFRGIRLHLSID